MQLVICMKKKKGAAEVGRGGGKVGDAHTGFRGIRKKSGRVDRERDREV